MKLSVKTLKDNRFEIEAQPNDTVMAVKKQIEEIQGKDTYPCGQQLLIHQGKVLKDDTTIEDNKITENGILVVMLTKSKTSSAAGAPSTSTASTVQPSQTSTPPAPASNPVEVASPVVSQPAAVAPAASVSAPETTAVQANADPYGEAASILVAGSNLEQTIQQMLDMGGGSWDRDTVVRALRAAYNNPERAVEYLYSGIPETAEIAVPVARSPPSNPGATDQGTNNVVAGESDSAEATAPSGGPNAAPLNLFPQGLPNLGAAAGGGALDFLRNNLQIVHFRRLDRSKEDDFCLELSKLSTYDDVVERVAQQLDLDNPSKIRLTAHNCYSQQPKPQAIRFRGVAHLSDMLIHYNQTSDILYYEILDIPLPELQGLKTLKVAFHHSTKDEVSVHSIRLPKQSTVGDVINELKTKVELSNPNADIRLLEVFYHKIYKIFPPSEKIENINEQYWTLRAEEVPEEEKNIGPQDRLIHVYHFTKDASQNHLVQNFGEPFFLAIHEGETLAEVKERIKMKLHVPDEEFCKWNFAFISLGRPEYLQDADIVSTRFQKRDVYGAWEQYLGLEHSDSAPKKSHQANHNRHTFEKPVKIYN